MSLEAVSTKRNRNLPQQLTLDHVSPATRLLEKRRQMFEVQEALDAQKEEFQRRETTFLRREEMLKKKDLELQESLIKFNKFLQENDSKRSRAEKKEREEIKQRTVKETEIVKLNEALADQKSKRDAMKRDLEKMNKYQKFLESVLDAEEEFQEIHDLLSRYETLDAAHSDLISRSIKADEENEMQRHDLQTYVREKTDDLLGYNNTIAGLQKQSEVAMTATRVEEANADRRLHDVADRTLQLGQVMMACDNIYQRCCDRSHVARRKAGGDSADLGVLVDKLMYIKDYLSDLSAIARSGAASRAAAEAKAAAAADSDDDGAAAGAAAKAAGGEKPPASRPPAVPTRQTPPSSMPGKGPQTVIHSQSQFPGQGSCSGGPSASGSCARASMSSASVEG